jgi:hypothetical protein
MKTIYIDSQLHDNRRRDQLYNGELFVHSATPSSTALVEHARAMIEEAFGSLQPTTAQHEMAVEDYAVILADLKPRFIHHPQSKEHIRWMVRELGCDPEKTYFDVPRMRSSTSDGYLTSGMPMRSIRIVIPGTPRRSVSSTGVPIYDVSAENVMAFHSRYWDHPIRNSSRDYNYYARNATSRAEAAKHIKKDTRQQPRPEEDVELDPQVQVVTPPGGMLVFSAAHLHSSVLNTSGLTRFSIDFRTVHLDDAQARRGAPNLDSECTGTTMRDYLRVSDLSHVPDEVVAMYDDDTTDRGTLVFQASQHD